jgi:hypothetical protein
MQTERHTIGVEAPVLLAHSLLGCMPKPGAAHLTAPRSTRQHYTQHHTLDPDSRTENLTLTPTLTLALSLTLTLINPYPLAIAVALALALTLTLTLRSSGVECKQVQLRAHLQHHGASGWSLRAIIDPPDLRRPLEEVASVPLLCTA